MTPERDPVCGMDVTPGEEAAKVDHDGRTYYFCSPTCAKKFQANPTKYIAGGHREGNHKGGAAPESYTPLIVVVGLILATTAALAFVGWRDGTLAVDRSLAHFMAGFFLVFAGFKLIDLKGFAEAYSTYDLLAKRLPAYGFVYPFIELAFGLAMIVAPTNRAMLITEVAVMTFSGIGVAVKLAKRETFRCACLGTFLKVPLTKVTLIEDFGMAALGVAMLLIA